MMQQAEPPKQASAKASALTLTLLYVALAGAWIAGSTPLLHYLLPQATAGQLSQYEIGKGLLFLAITAIFLFLLIYRRLLTLIASQEVVRLSEQRYRQLIKTAEEGVWMIDASGKTVFANDKMAELLGYSSQEMLGQPLERFLDPDILAVFMKDLCRSRQGFRQQRDLRLRRKEGADFWTIVSSMPIYDDQGQYTGVLATITDITARKQAETRLAEAEAKYRALVEESLVGVYIV
jgi:PAS domain S-box-containing protein